MTVQYITDSKGHRKFVQVQIPIRDWESSGEVFVIEKENSLDALSALSAEDYRKVSVANGNKVLAKSMKNYER
jgi:hypothetical protein